MASDSQKFIARNRAPRVQIEYDVELYGAQKAVQLPFVTGVIADLAGRTELPGVSDRDFLEIDIDNFDARMKKMAPTAMFSVPNTLTGDGNMAINLTFESMDDFSPQGIARKIDPLRELLEAREQLSDLMSYMDGKAGAEALIENLLSSPDALAALSAAQATASASDAALASLRNLSVASDPVEESADVLANLRNAASDDAPATDEAAAVLGGLTPPPVSDDPQVDVANVLGSIAPASVAENDGPDAGDILGGIARQSALKPEDAVNLGDLLPEVAAQEVIDTTADILGSLDVAVEPKEDANVDLGDLLPEVAAVETVDDMADALESLDPPAVHSEAEAAEIADILVEDATTTAHVADDDLDLGLDDDTPAVDADAEAVDVEDDLDFDLGMDNDAATEPEPHAVEVAADDDLDLVLDDDGPAAVPAAEAVDVNDDLDFDLGLNDTAAEPVAPLIETAADDDLDLGLDDDTPAVIADAEAADVDDDAAEPVAPVIETAADDDLDLGLDDDAPAVIADAEAADADDDLNFDLGLDDDLELGLDDTGPSAAGATLVESTVTLSAFGALSAPRSDAARNSNKRFRLALLGDFSGRAARGQIETGAALAARAGRILDPDTVEDLIAEFATTLVLPLGQDGAGMEVPLKELDDLHPDELYENVPLFAELRGLRQQLSSGGTAANAMARLHDWGQTYQRPVTAPRLSSSGAKIRADAKLTDFQKLIGGVPNVATASPLDEMLARIVGPYLRDVPDSNAQAMIEAVDEALTGAMRLLLHHPDFQSLEAQWRTLDLIARSIETDNALDVILYDVSAEELAADLTASDDLDATGILGLLRQDTVDEDAARGPFSAVVGLYEFAETPPHAGLLGRIARVAAHLDAPFIASMDADFINTPMEDRHPLVASAWDDLRGMAEAGYLGLATPRFMLRRPYGAKTDPIDAFAFEEFTMQEGLSGLLWANPGVLVAILMARSFTENGPSMQLGQIMALGDVPFHVVTDSHGDQIALPSTERLFNLDKHRAAVQRGYMPVLGIKGRDEVRLGSFNALSGEPLMGPWSDIAPPPPSEPKTPRTTQQVAAEDADLDDLLADFDDVTPDASAGDLGDIDADLADLLGDL